MGIPFLIMGESGSGKTYSIKNFDKDEVGIFLIEKTRLPFRKDFKIVKNATYSSIVLCTSNTVSVLLKYIFDIVPLSVSPAFSTTMAIAHSFLA